MYVCGQDALQKSQDQPQEPKHLHITWMLYSTSNNLDTKKKASTKAIFLG
jgi:hypothetical protein